MNTSIVNHIRLAWAIFSRDMLILFALSWRWTRWADAKFWALTRRIESLRAGGAA